MTKSRSEWKSTCRRCGKDLGRPARPGSLRLCASCRKATAHERQTDLFSRDAPRCYYCGVAFEPHERPISLVNRQGAYTHRGCVPRVRLA